MVSGDLRAETDCFRERMAERVPPAPVCSHLVSGERGQVWLYLPLPDAAPRLPVLTRLRPHLLLGLMQGG